MGKAKRLLVAPARAVAARWSSGKPEWKGEKEKEAVSVHIS